MSSPLHALWEISPAISLQHDIVGLVVKLNVSDGWLISANKFAITLHYQFLKCLLRLVHFCISIINLYFKFITYFATSLHLGEETHVTPNQLLSETTTVEVQGRVDGMSHELILGVVASFGQSRK